MGSSGAVAPRYNREALLRYSKESQRLRFADTKIDAKNLQKFYNLFTQL